MNVQDFTISVNIPSVDDFASRYHNYGSLARDDGRFLFDLLMSPQSYVKAQIATLDLKLPAIDGIAETCYRAVKEQNSIQWNDNLKRFVGAVVCNLMEANGFQKTNKKKAVRHHAFTKGEFYELSNG